MKSYKDMINEVLTKSTPALVHVSDGSGYDDTPHPKDIEHVKTGAMHTGGQWHSHSGKGAFFKFKSKEDAEQFKRHVDKCPHKSCYADHVNEAVEYKGIGTDVVDKKKKLNPQPNFTTDKKQVKDFKEEAEQIDESSLHRKHFQMVADLIRGHESAEKRKELAHHHAELFKKENPRFDHAKFMKAAGVNEEIQVEGKVYDPITKKMVATKPIKVQAGGGATRNGVPVETGPSKYKQSLKKEEVDLWQVKNTKTGNVYHSSSKYPISKNSPTLKKIKAAGGDHVHAALYKNGKLVEETIQIDELSKDTLASYAKKASHDARIKQHVAADFKSKEAHARNPRKKETWGSIAKKYQSKAWKREDGHDKAVDKLAGTKTKPSRPGDIYGKSFTEEVQIDEVSKSTLMRYIPKASRDVADHVAMAKERQVTMAHATHAGNYDMAKKESGKSQISFKKAMQRLKGIDTATKKLGTQKEEVEQIDELSKGLVARYANKVAKTTQDNYDKSKDKFQFSSGREDGMKNAVKRLTKEEVELDEANLHSYTQELIKSNHPDHKIFKHATSLKGDAYKKYAHQQDTDVRDKLLQYVKEELDEAIAKKLPVQHAVDAVHATLGPKSATRFLSHLSPGTDKHTSWDKVNDALVKQGVQTHHIASIAQKTSHMNEEVIDESRGHKVLNTFFKNREVAQRAYQGNPAKDAEVAQGGGSPADQGIAAAKADYKKMNKENVNPALMAILKKRQEAQKKKAEDKKKVNEAKAPAVHAAPPKKTKSTAKEYASASIPGTKRVAHAKPDDNEVGGGTATRIAEDQYTSEYKIKSFVDPVTGENKTRKIRPHRINFKSSKMNAAPAQMTEPTKVTEDDKVYDEKWKKVNFKDFTKGAK